MIYIISNYKNLSMQTNRLWLCNNIWFLLTRCICALSFMWSSLEIVCSIIWKLEWFLYLTIFKDSVVSSSIQNWKHATVMCLIPFVCLMSLWAIVPFRGVRGVNTVYENVTQVTGVDHFVNPTCTTNMLLTKNLWSDKFEPKSSGSWHNKGKKLCIIM